MSSASVTETHPNFDAVERGGETIWVHKTKPVWVVYYEAIEGSMSFQREFWQGYRAIEPQKRGRKVWAHNNKAISTKGFPTLEAALEAADLEEFA